MDAEFRSILPVLSKTQSNPLAVFRHLRTGFSRPNSENTPRICGFPRPPNYCRKMLRNKRLTLLRQFCAENTPQFIGTIRYLSVIR